MPLPEDLGGASTSKLAFKAAHHALSSGNETFYVARHVPKVASCLGDFSGIDANN
jgi:hypothetical protein